MGLSSLLLAALLLSLQGASHEVVRPSHDPALGYRRDARARARTRRLLAPPLEAVSSSSGKNTLGAGGRDIPVNCPNMIPNTPETAIEFIPTSAMCASFTNRRIRFEMFGDLPSPSIEMMGPCVASDAPTIRFISGHANVFIHDTNTSVTENGQPLTFGELIFPGALLEKGVVVANDAVGNVLEVIWPTIAGTGVTPPVVRIQLARWNLSLVSPSETYDIEWDMIAERDSTQMHMKGRAVHINLAGSPVPQVGAGAPGVCPSTLEATSDTVITQFANIVQFRPSRLRLEIVGDVAAGTMQAMGACTATDTPTFLVQGGEWNLYRAGTTQSVTFSGHGYTFGPLVFPGVLLEPGVVVATDVDRNVLEIVWPGLVGLGQGPPILRMQMDHWGGYVRTGAKVDAMMRFDAVGQDGIMASYTAHAYDLTVPVMK